MSQGAVSVSEKAMTHPSKGATIAVAVLLVVPFCVLWVGAWLAGAGPSGPADWISNSGSRIAMEWPHVNIYHLVGAYADPARPWALWATVAVLGLAAVAVVTGFALSRGGLPVLHSTGRRRHADLGRPQGWASAWDLRTLMREQSPGSFFLGTKDGVPLRTDGETSVMVTGPTRSGKSSGLIIPNLLEWEGPCVATSMKSELIIETGAVRQGKGDVYIYDPMGVLGDEYETTKWSFLTGCQDYQQAVKVADWFTQGITGGGKSSGNDWEHWRDGCRLLDGVAFYIAAHNGKSVVDIYDWLASGNFGMMREYLNAVVDDSHSKERAMTDLLAVVSKNEKERQSLLSTAVRPFQVFRDKRIALTSASTQLDLESFLDGCNTLYLVSPTPKAEKESVAPLFTALLNTICHTAMKRANRYGRLKLPLGLMLDELPNICPIEDLPELASTGAGMGILIMTIVQDMSQLVDRYGRDRANTIWSNHTAKMLLPRSSEPVTQEYFNQILGQRNDVVQTDSFGDGKRSFSRSTRETPKANGEAMRMLQEGTAILALGSLKCAYIRLETHYRIGGHFAKFAGAARVHVPYITHNGGAPPYQPFPLPPFMGVRRLAWRLSRGST